jgi:hypothetical protein
MLYYQNTPREVNCISSENAGDLRSVYKMLNSTSGQADSIWWQQYPGGKTGKKML